MFEKLKKLIEEAQKQAAQLIDPVVFNHPLAQKTDWFPLASGGSNFKTHRLDASDPELLVFKCTKGAYLFSGVFIFFGLLGLILPLAMFMEGDMKQWSMVVFAVIFGGIFLGVGLLMLKLMTTPRVFDIFQGVFYKARKKPVNDMNQKVVKKTTLTKLNEVKAIQVIRERIRSKNSTYYSYEINLVLDDASRVNVIDHGKHQAVIEDAEILANTLNVPLWNGS